MSEICTPMLALLATLGLTFTTHSYGRFLDEDRDEIDREELLNTENFNDEISYRAPIHWEDLYDSANAALRINSGSYNARRFMYEEDLKLVSAIDRPVTLSFIQERDQNRLGNFNDRRLALQFNTLRPFYFSILADGDSYKKNADFGAAAAYELNDVLRLETYYWEVNPIYNQKRDKDSKNKVLTPTHTWGARLTSRLLNAVNLEMAYEGDSPYKFRQSDGPTPYLYAYAKRHYALRLFNGDKTHGSFWEMRAEREQKLEGKRYFSTDDDLLEKTLDRQSDWLEARYSLGVRDCYQWTTGVVYMERDADYVWKTQQVSDAELTKIPTKESPKILRNEVGLYSTLFHRIHVGGWRDHGYQLGIFMNRVRLNSAGTIKTANEVKLQTAWNYFVTDRIQAFLNATFNLDGLYESYPYQDEPFKPWDGGGLNILASF